MTYRVTFTNLEYDPDETFPTLESALAYGQRCHFEFAVWSHEGEMVAAWSPIGGVRYYPNR